MTPPLVELIANAQAGCIRSRGELLEQYRGYLKVLARAQVSPSIHRKTDPSDIVQETFLCAHGTFDRFRGSTDAELSVWLQRILASRIVDLYRFHSSHKRDFRLEKNVNDSLTQSSVALGQVLIDPGPSPSELMSQKEKALLVANAIENLPQDYRTVILLRHVRALPYADVAVVMQRSVGSVKKLWVRALADLRRSVEDIR